MEILKGKTAVKWNNYGTDTSLGFANAWNVALFDSRENAKKAVEDFSRFDIEIITHREVPTFHGCTIEPFSGKKLFVENSGWNIFTESAGYIGEIEYGYRD